MSELIGGSTDDIWKRIQRDSERQSELEHERRIALIRLQSHALTWTGTPERLISAITKWYESGWLIAPSLEDALQKAAFHFLKPDGTPVITPRSGVVPVEVEQGPAENFSSSPNYQKIVFRGQAYDLTQFIYAPKILKVLHESLNNGEPGMTTSQIRKKADLQNNGKMYDWFRGTGLWKHLVILVGKDLYRLDITISS